MSTLTIGRVFSIPETSPYDQIKWTKKTVAITDDRGKTLFEQKDIEVPESWTDLAVKIVASKYFYGAPNTPERENSVSKLIHRVANTIANWGVQSGYFDEANGRVFYDELSALCLNQYGVFNSPVWFNVGLWHEYKALTTTRRAKLKSRPCRIFVLKVLHASSKVLKTTWTPSCLLPPVRPCCSSLALALVLI